MIFYESPHRVVKTLLQMAEVFGAERPMAACREISKLHEDCVRGTIAEVAAHFPTNEPRGEIVLIIGGGENAKQAARRERRERRDGRRQDDARRQEDEEDDSAE